jgi:hypothetical protein
MFLALFRGSKGGSHLNLSYSQKRRAPKDYCYSNNTTTLVPVMVAVRIGPDLCLAAVGAPDYRDDGRQGRSWRRPGLCAEDRVREHTMKGAGLEHAVPLGSSGLSDPHYCVRGVDRVADLRPPLCVGGRRQ